MNSDVVCMDLGKVPPTEQRTRFLAVGLADGTVRVISLDPQVRVQFKVLFFQRLVHMATTQPPWMAGKIRFVYFSLTPVWCVSVIDVIKAAYNQCEMWTH